MPQRYTGPTVMLRDTVKVTAVGRAEFYVLERYNGAELIDSQVATDQASSRPGGLPYDLFFSDSDFNVKRTQHRVPIREGLFHVRAVRRLANAWQDMRYPAPTVEGDIKFTPQPGHTYVVDGAIERASATVLIRDETTGEVVQTISSR